MRTILRFENVEGKGPASCGPGDIRYWFNKHYQRMASAVTAFDDFEGDHFCAIDMAGAPYWLHDECLADAEKVGLQLHVLTVRECLDETPSALWATSSPLVDDQGRPREYQVMFRREDVVSCRTIRPTEFRHVAYP